jgi:CRISPR/Cas system-associated exonuclease Cas4 (RecB family)
MSAKDLFHNEVKRALEKADWTITNDPLELEWEEVRVKIDLAAEKLIAAQRAETKIAIEIKSFISPSPISEFHTALGQFLNYRLLLETQDSDRQLYLAIPIDTYISFFQSIFAQTTIQRYQLKLIIYNPVTEEIVTWID